MNDNILTPHCSFRHSVLAVSSSNRGPFSTIPALSNDAVLRLSWPAVDGGETAVLCVATH